MRYLIVGAVAVLITLGAVSALLSERQPSYVEYARQDAELAAIARAEYRAEAAQPALTVVGVLMPLAVFTGFLGFLGYLGALGAAHVERVRHERSPNGEGLLPVRKEDLGAVAPQALGAYHTARISEAQRAVVPQVPHVLHYSYEASGLGGQAVPPVPPDLDQTLPGPIDLAALGFLPSPQAILLGLGLGGERITVTAPQLCHVALVGATGGGKSNLLRLLLPQLQAIGAKVCLADPHYAPFDPETGEDWRLITQRLHLAPAVSPNEIGGLFSYLEDELGRRLGQRRNGQRIGPPIFLAMDELPVIADTVPGAPVVLGRLLREGRKVGLYTVGAAQTMLVKVVGGDSAARECYRTAFYTGGDLRSAAALLDLPQRAIPEGELGQGLVFLRSVATAPAKMVRVPYASNAGIAGLLEGPRPTSGPASVAASGPASSATSLEAAAEAEAEAATGEPLPAHQGAPKWTTDEARIIAALKAGKSVGDIAADLAGAKGGRRYQEAAKRVGDVIKRAIG